MNVFSKHGAHAVISPSHKTAGGGEGGKAGGAVYAAWFQSRGVSHDRLMPKNNHLISYNNTAEKSQRNSMLRDKPDLGVKEHCGTMAVAILHLLRNIYDVTGTLSIRYKVATSNVLHHCCIPESRVQH